MENKQNTFKNLSFIFGILGLIILIFLILPAIVGINMMTVFFNMDSNVKYFLDPLKMVVFFDFFLGIATIILYNLQPNKKAKTGFVMGVIICVISLPLVVISLFAG